MPRIGQEITHVWVRGSDAFTDIVNAVVNRYSGGELVATPETVRVVPNFAGVSGDFAVIYTPEFQGTYVVRARNQNWNEYVWQDIVQVERARPNAALFHIWEVDLPGAASRLQTTLYHYSVTIADDPSTAERSNATEPVIVSEIPGTNGSMHITYIPEKTGLYKLRVFDPETFREYWWEDHVAEIVLTTEDMAYCALRDVERHAQLTFDPNSNPTDAQVLLFMAQRAALIYARLGSVLGNEPPGPVGYPKPHIETDTGRGMALDAWARDTNAIGAAADALQAAGAGEGVNASDRVVGLLAMFNDRMGDQADVVARQYGVRETFSDVHVPEDTDLIPPDVRF